MQEVVEEYYKREMFNLRRFSCESGIWQFHQAANVLGCQLQSIYPHVPLENLRRDFHRIILPSRFGWSRNCGEDNVDNEYLE